ncbi:hypothetical protein [Fibrobacter sp. UWB2]|uniref:hypothetical protein n=1 Tax=Fibrobacter sp. UWB2 TaxID=1964358 RepID=UPI001303D129|nr:hypothetical protein [Fibrobacter sp. UWB2]
MKQEQETVELYRALMTKALAEDRIDDLKSIVKEAESFQKNARAYPVFYDMEKMLLSYFVKDYEFLSNVDSVKDFVKHGYYYDPFRDLLYAKLKALINSGKLKETLKDVENESDRAFIYLFLRGCFESKETMTPLVEKYKFQVTKRKQLTYLVRRFWFRKEFDLEHFLAASVGGGLVVPFGSLSDKVNLGGAMDVAVDYMSDKHFYEGFLLINGSGVVNPDSLQFFDIGLIFNYGYRFFKKKYLNLYGYGSVGLGFDGLNASEEEMKNGNLDLPSQVYPSLGAGLIADVFFTEVKKDGNGSLHGIRFRAGVKNVWAHNALKASGARLFVSIEWIVHQHCEVPAKFDYSFRENWTE